VSVRVGEGGRVGVPVEVEVCVEVTVGVLVGVSVCVRIGVFVLVGETDGVAVCRLAFFGFKT